jgi:hypothetical protein
MYIPYQFMSALEDDRLRTAARKRAGRGGAARAPQAAPGPQGPPTRPPPGADAVPPGGRLTARCHRIPLHQEEP